VTWSETSQRSVIRVDGRILACRYDGTGWVNMHAGSQRGSGSGPVRVSRLAATPSGTGWTVIPLTTTLTAIGFAVPDSARQWAHRPAPAPGRHVSGHRDRPADPPGIMVDGRPFFVVGHTSGGAPYGVFADEITDDLARPPLPP
jgi:hypothetical protein